MRRQQPPRELSGSTLAYSSPKRFGVCPVLHRLLVPRHPPCALSNLTMRKQLHACRLRFSASSYV
ncbi:hypothetical protein B9L23_02985 [Parageobacillus galactosidasius]|uniref:Uncharacterized protein n=1 Tax=Parageobacillus galactosidasius TaxID=883812 RepID=A0A226QMZ7_9BACL|nr:hypothetical protein B9L23_02985 [Parageobacillus galactosidasius]